MNFPMKTRHSLLPLLLLAGALLAAPLRGTAQESASTASVAAPKEGKSAARFLELHESFLKRAQAGPIGVLFLGDSITEGWRKAPEVWDRFYGDYQPANFGISGDRTQHVLWRIEHGELDGIAPKVVVLMIGTNNTGENTGAEIAAADRRIIDLIRAKLPQTKVLLLAIFPRGPRKDRETGQVAYEVILDAQKRMAAINAANAELAKLDDGKTIRYLDISTAFYGNDGTIPYIIMPDQLHPNAAGYELWAAAMKPLLAEMMKD